MKVNLGHSLPPYRRASQADIKGIRLAPPHDRLGEEDRRDTAHRLRECKGAARAYGGGKPHS